MGGGILSPSAYQSPAKIQIDEVTTYKDSLVNDLGASRKDTEQDDWYNFIKKLNEAIFEMYRYLLQDC